jgi:hypothetical protein
VSGIIIGFKATRLGKINRKIIKKHWRKIMSKSKNKKVSREEVLDALISSYENIAEKLRKNNERIEEIKKELSVN